MTKTYLATGWLVLPPTFEHLSREFVLRCRPVVSIDAPAWLDLVVGASARDLSFVAHGPNGRGLSIVVR